MTTKDQVRLHVNNFCEGAIIWEQIKGGVLGFENYVYIVFCGQDWLMLYWHPLINNYQIAMKTSLLFNEHLW